MQLFAASVLDIQVKYDPILDPALSTVHTKMFSKVLLGVFSPHANS